MNRHINNNDVNDELLRLVDRYFEGETSTAEERRLRTLLAASDSEAEEVNAARAVMGVFAVARRAGDDAGSVRAPRRHRRALLATVSVAASVAIIIGAALSVSDISIGKQPSGGTMMLASDAGNRQGRHDSIAMLMKGDGKSNRQARHSVAMASARVNTPDNPDDIAALISSEMGCMAEAQRSVYESITDDFVSISEIMK